jgi:hypothetical protein
MKGLKNTLAALGFICFSSLALLPVGMTLCGPFMSRLLHHAKKVHHVNPDPSPRLGVARPQGTTFERDVIPAATDPARSLFEHLSVTRSPAEHEPDRTRNRLLHGFIRSVKVSTLVFQPVLNL